jgi:hypothetical protein
MELGFELRALCLQSRHFTTAATIPRIHSFEGEWEEIIKV